MDVDLTTSESRIPPRRILDLPDSEQTLGVGGEIWKMKTRPSGIGVRSINWTRRVEFCERFST